MRYNTVVIDPPWDISMAGKVKLRPNRSKELPYKTMTLDEIKGFPLDEFANNGAHIYMWTTNKMLKHTWDIFTALGVNYHLTLPWVKTNGMCPMFAYKFASEFCMLGFYGKPMQKFNKCVRLNWIQTAQAKAGSHSAKPDEFYELISEMSPGPMIDCFARKPHTGFSGWGDEYNEIPLYDRNE
jgi:N6-adenosine-specific RNA methylase IME4|tara:strand:- start:39 stop:587 length:549 start_codon:yes stop_codon:yes gene_type:complete